MRTSREHVECPGLIIVGGMHGSGKTTLVEDIVHREGYARMPAFTTRPKRTKGENEYRHASQAELEGMKARGELLNLDEVNGEYYAVAQSDIDGLHDQGIVAVKEIHPNNFHKFEEYCDNTLSAVLVNKPFVERSGRVIDPSDHELINYFTATKLGKMALDLTDFDTVSEAASHLIRGYHLERKYRNEYPDPRKIDSDNQDAYSAIAPVFIDSLRLTTRDFHEASVGILSRIISHIPAGSRVLEIGSGSNWLQNTVDLTHLDVVHQESSRGMLDEYPTDRTRLWAPIRKLPIRSCDMDYIVGSLVDGMMYPQALLEMQRVLKERGRIILSYPSSVWAESSRGGEKLACFINEGALLQAHSFSPKREELEPLLRDIGFRLEEFIECPAAERDRSYYSPALFRADGRLPDSVVTVVVAVKETRDGKITN